MIVRPHVAAVRLIAGAAFALLTLAGCAASQVKDLGDGKRSISACSDAGLTNPQVKAVQAADGYCGHFGQVAVVDRFDEGSCGKQSTSATLIFTCR